MCRLIKDFSEKQASFILKSEYSYSTIMHLTLFLLHYHFTGTKTLKRICFYAEIFSFNPQFFIDPALVAYEEDTDRLRFFDSCSRYRNEIRKNKTILTEYYNFLEGPEMQQVLQEVIADHRLDDLNFTTSNSTFLLIFANFSSACLYHLVIISKFTSASLISNMFDQLCPCGKFEDSHRCCWVIIFIKSIEWKHFQ